LGAGFLCSLHGDCFDVGLVFKARRLVYHWNSRLESNKEEEKDTALTGTGPVTTWLQAMS